MICEFWFNKARLLEDMIKIPHENTLLELSGRAKKRVRPALLAMFVGIMLLVPEFVHSNDIGLWAAYIIIGGGFLVAYFSCCSWWCLNCLVGIKRSRITVPDEFGDDEEYTGRAAHIFGWLGVVVGILLFGLCTLLPIGFLMDLFEGF
jgi:hypothetical protein